MLTWRRIALALGAQLSAAAEELGVLDSLRALAFGSVAEESREESDVIPPADRDYDDEPKSDFSRWLHGRRLAELQERQAEEKAPDRL